MFVYVVLVCNYYDLTRDDVCQITLFGVFSNKEAAQASIAKEHASERRIFTIEARELQES